MSRHPIVVGLVLALIATSGVAQKEQFSRSKPHVNVAVLGEPADVPLAAAVAATWDADGLRVQPPLTQLLAPGGSSARGITINTSHVEYETTARHHELLDCTDDPTTIKNMVTGAAQMDGAILVVSGSEGPMPQTREHVLLARQVRVPSLVVFLDGADIVSDADLDLVEMEVRDLLTTQGFDGTATPVIRGSALGGLNRDPAWAERIRQLMETSDAWIPLPVPRADRPFLMAIEGVQVTRDGTVATGRIETGHVAPGDVLEVVGSGPGGTVTVDAVDGELLPTADAGHDQVTRLHLTGAPADLRRGQVIAAPGTTSTHQELFSLVVGNQSGPTIHPLVPGTYTFELRTAVVQGELTLLPGLPAYDEGMQEVHVHLDEPVALSKGTRLSIREGGHTVGAGQVIEILD